MQQQRKTFRRLFRRHRKRVIRYGLLVANITLLLAVVGFVVRNPQTGQSARQNALGLRQSGVVANPLDELSSADIAVNVARLASLDEATAVTNLADSVNAQLAISSDDEQVVTKPQLVATDLKSYRDLQTYVTKEGDSISALAARFGITSETIRWSNGLSDTGDSLLPGKELKIPPVNGLAYTVAEGDTAESIASKFGVDKNRVIAFNDAEVSGLKVGTVIVIPDGEPVPAPVTIAAAGGGGYGGFSFGNAPVYGGNGYDYGYCTWWASVRRAQIGRPIPSNLGNAITWKSLAARAGLGTGNTPAAGAVIWTPASSGYGHVGFVESVNPDGTVNVSDMNVRGWNVVSNRTLSPAEAAGFGYIY